MCCVNKRSYVTDIETKSNTHLLVYPRWLTVVIMFGQHKEYFSKKYRRRTFGVILMCFMTLMSAFNEGDETGGNSDLSPDKQFRYRNYQPFAPYTQLLSAREIKITWLPIFYRQSSNDYFELYNGEELEYVGKDLFHIARRLNYETEYAFKLRVCGSVPGDCSKYSIQRYQRTGKKTTSNHREKNNIFYQLLQLNVFHVPTFSLLLIVVMTGFIVWCFMSYVVSFFNNIQTDIDDITDVEHSSTYNKEKKIGTLITHKSSSKKSFLIENGVVNTSCPNFKKIMESNISLEDDKVPNSQSLWNNQIDKLEKDKYRNNNSSSSEENIIQPAIKNQTHVLTTPKIPRKRRFRRRSKTAPSSAYVSHNTQVGELSVSDSEMKGNAHTKLCRVKTPNIVVVIDNSNIFIGAREAACHEKSGIRPRHVKLKLIQLLHIAEEGRKVTRGIAGASSPTTTSAAVWDIYRRSGYSVDLEDRRGKDEQRVDEQLHLAIYRALVELPAQTLVIATGDGNKGKSRSNTSFVECAKRAIYLGWKVEVLSWRHCLSVEWLKMANEKMLKIKFLDEHIHQLTSIEKRHERRSP